MSKLGNQTICQNFQKKNKLQKEKLEVTWVKEWNENAK